MLNVNDILISKTDELRDIPKNSKVVIYQVLDTMVDVVSESINSHSYYRVRSVYGEEKILMIFNFNEILHYFWTISEYRKLKIEEIIEESDKEYSNGYRISARVEIPDYYNNDDDVGILI